MKKKIMKVYKIFILFLLLSISVFAAKKVTVDESNGNKAWVEKVEFLEGNKIKISLITRTEKDIEDLTIKETNGFREIVAYKREILTSSSDTKNVYRWSIIYEIGEDDIKTISFEIKKNNPKDGTISIGGKEISYTLLESIEIKTYEELYQVDKSKVIKDGYKFTKGEGGSYSIDPAIYVIIPANDPGGEKIGKLKVQKIGEDGKVEGEKIIIVNGGDEAKEVKVSLDFSEGVNTVKITPINISGVEGKLEEFKFVVDTRINTSYLEGGIIGDLDNDGKIVIDLANVKELSGVIGYDYTFIVEDKTSTSNGEVSVEGESYLEPSKNFNLGEVKIDTFGFIGGSKGTLFFTVYDKLGNEKTFEKTYFIPVKSGGITSKLEGEVKERRSKVKIFGEGSDNKFGVDSSLDRSSED